MIKLDLLERENFKKIIEWNENKSADFILQWSGPLYKYPLTLEQIENYFLNEVDDKDSNIYVYKISIIDTDKIIGTIELRETDKDNKTGRVCRFLIGEEGCRGKGFGATALKEVLAIGFKDLNFEKITLGVFEFNNSAIKCYENAGFTKERFIENSRKSSTGYWNSYEMAITKADYCKLMHK